MDAISEIVAHLCRWPLTHGFLNSPVGKSDEIFRNGLIAPGSEGKGFNSFDYDKILGRKDFVFVSTLKLDPDYSFGSDTFVLIDPIVLQRPYTQFALYDIGKIIDQIPLSTDAPRSSYPAWIREPAAFDRIVIEQMQCARDAFSKEKGLKEVSVFVPKRYAIPYICRSKEFRDYLQKYSVGYDQFFKWIATTLIERNEDLTAYLNRDKLWPFTEEILVPKKISAKNILGLWDGANWHRWHFSSDSESENVIENFITLKKEALRT